MGQHISKNACYKTCAYLAYRCAGPVYTSAEMRFIFVNPMNSNIIIKALRTIKRFWRIGCVPDVTPSPTTLELRRDRILAAIHPPHEANVPVRGCHYAVHALNKLAPNAIVNLLHNHGRLFRVNSFNVTSKIEWNVVFTTIFNSSLYLFKRQY